MTAHSSRGVGRRLVVTAKVHDAALLPDEATIFPTEREPSGGFTQDELFRLSPAYSRLYRHIIDAVAPRFAAHHLLPEEAVRIPVRNGVIVPTHFLLDRALRLDRFCKRHADTPLEVASVSSAAYLDQYETFRDATSGSYELNQSLLVRLASTFDLGIVARPPPPLAGSRAATKFRNTNFDQTLPTQARRWASRASRRTLRTIAPSKEGRYPALPMGEATGALEAAGFYAPGRFVDVHRRMDYPPAARSPEDRAAILEPALSTCEEAVFDFLAFAGVREGRAKPLVAAFVSYVSEAFPPDLFEGVPGHLARARTTLAPFAGRTVAFMHAKDVESVSILAAARAQGLRLVGFQHGGHEGYEDDFVQPMEMDYPHADVFVSWGWAGLPTYDPAREHVPVVPLPSPWLSQRSKWRTTTGQRATHDMLFMPNKIYRWPPAAPCGASISRIDHVGRYAALLRDLVESAANRRISILHKPYNADTLDLVPDAVAALPVLGRGFYELWNGNEKGMSDATLARGRLVLWDQPGTGFLECIARRIPTLVLWPRYYNRELGRARPVFRDLEVVGVVVRDIDRLLDEVDVFKADEEAWMQDPTRRAALGRFAREYGWSDGAWAKRWREFLDTWRAHDAAAPSLGQTATAIRTSPMTRDPS